MFLKSSTIISTNIQTVITFIIGMEEIFMANYVFRFKHDHSIKGNVIGYLWCLTLFIKLPCIFSICQSKNIMSKKVSF